MNESQLDILADKIAARISITPRWMLLKQAVMYSNIGKARLIDLVKRKKIKGFQDTKLATRPWKIDRQCSRMDH